VCTNAASRARDGDPRFASVALAGYTCAYRKSSPSILVMQSTQDRTGQNASAASAAREIGASLFNDK
jgi:hypothetical protein